MLQTNGTCHYGIHRRHLGIQICKIKTVVARSASQVHANGFNFQYRQIFANISETGLRTICKETNCSKNCSIPTTYLKTTKKLAFLELPHIIFSTF